MSRTLDESAYWSWLLKTGQISQPIVQHNNPALFGLSEKDAINSRIRYFRASLPPLINEFNAIKAEYLKGTLKQWLLPYLFFPKWKLDCEVLGDHFPKPFFNLSILEYKELIAYYLGDESWPYKLMNCWQEKIDKLNKSIYFNRQRLKTGERKSYNLEEIKRVPINQITEILPSGFFKTNPFRNEKSPSNSLFWYKNTNRFCDFATNKTGDVIDVWMAKENCTIQQALKELSSLSA